MAIKLALNYPLYTRKTPSTEEAPLGYLDDESVIEITDVVIGKPIDSNGIWYKTVDGVYYWSGGTDTVEFIFPGKDFLQLTLKEQEGLVSQAMEYYFDRLLAKVDGFTGMSVTFKKSQDEYLGHYALVVQVREKEINPFFLIPDILPYYGFAIPTDVIAASKAVSGGLGDSVRRKGFISVGSAGFVTTKRNGRDRLLITNYHVACTDLMRRSPRQLSLAPGDSVKDPEVLMTSRDTGNSKMIGRVIEGHLDRFDDIALIQLNENIKLTNDIEFIGDISGIRTVESMKKDFQPETITVQMFGAVSAFSTGKIISLNARQPIAYLDGDFEHLLKGLIQVTKMSQPGDSGSAVVDSANSVVGILVASDSDFSYVLPIESILKNFTLNQI